MSPARCLTTSARLLSRQISLVGAVNRDLVQRANFEPVAGPNHRCRSILLDHRRTSGTEPRLQHVAVENSRIEPTTGAGDKNPPRFCRLRLCGGARQARDVGPLEPRKSGKMQRLELCRRLPVGMAVAPFVIAFKSRADRRS